MKVARKTKPTDVLFRQAPEELKRLNKQAQKELRLKRRAEWKEQNLGN